MQDVVKLRKGGSSEHPAIQITVPKWVVDKLDMESGQRFLVDFSKWENVGNEQE